MIRSSLIRCSLEEIVSSFRKSSSSQSDKRSPLICCWRNVSEYCSKPIASRRRTSCGRTMCEYIKSLSIYYKHLLVNKKVCMQHQIRTLIIMPVMAACIAWHCVNVLAAHATIIVFILSAKRRYIILCCIVTPRVQLKQSCKSYYSEQWAIIALLWLLVVVMDEVNVHWMMMYSIPNESMPSVMTKHWLTRCALMTASYLHNFRL